MTLEILTTFFMWCTLLTGGLLVLGTLFMMFAPGLSLRTQMRFCPIPEDTMRVIHYCFLGGLKIVFLVFCLVPYVALRIMA